jgi:hypothetical protein
MLGIDKKDLFPYDYLGNSSIVSSFLGIEEYPEYNHKLCVLLRYNDKRYQELEELFSTYGGLIHSYETDYLHTMYIYNIPDSHKQSFEYLMEGKYSKIFDEHKQEIVKFNSLPYADHGKAIYNILYKKEDAYKLSEKHYNIVIPRNQEAESIINFDKQVYKNEHKLFKIHNLSSKSEQV